jgi:hypothetical protein
MPIPGFLANIEDEHPDVGAGSHKVQRGWVVLVPLQGLFGLQLLLNNNRTEYGDTNNGQNQACGSGSI